MPTSETGQSLALLSLQDIYVNVTIQNTIKLNGTYITCTRHFPHTLDNYRDVAGRPGTLRGMGSEAWHPDSAASWQHPEKF